MTLCKCKKPNFSSHLDKKKRIHQRCKTCHGLPKTKNNSEYHQYISKRIKEGYEMAELEIKTTYEIHSYFKSSEDKYFENEEHFDQQDFSKACEKKWVSLESLKEFLKENGRVIDLNHSEKDMIYTSELLKLLEDNQVKPEVGVTGAANE